MIGKTNTRMLTGAEYDAWNSNLSTVFSNSANWNYQGLDVRALTGNWESTYSTVFNTSANWNYQGLDVRALTANWESTYSTVFNTSARWGSGFTTVNSNSARWENSYTTSNTNSARWSSGYTTINANSARWSSGWTTTNSNSAKWNSTFTTVNANSANWSSIGGNSTYVQYNNSGVLGGDNGMTYAQATSSLRVFGNISIHSSDTSSEFTVQATANNTNLVTLKLSSGATVANTYVNNVGAPITEYTDGAGNSTILLRGSGVTQFCSTAVKVGGNIGVDWTGANFTVQCNENLSKDIISCRRGDNVEVFNLYLTSTGHGAFVLKNGIGTLTTNLVASGHSYFTGGNVSFGHDGDFGGRVNIKAPSDNYNLLTFYRSNNTNVGSIYTDSDGDAVLTLGNAAGTTRTLLNSNGSSYILGGSVGIGIDAPGSELAVVGSISASGTVTANGGTSPQWGSAYSTVFANSANWNYQGLDVRALSANWQNTYSTVNSTSSRWESSWTTTNSQSANNASVYTTVNANSASWVGGGGGSDVSTLSANWQNAYTTIYQQSADNASVYSTVNANSASWVGGGGGSDVTLLSANWQNSYTTVAANSATWGAGGGDAAPYDASNITGDIYLNRDNGNFQKLALSGTTVARTFSAPQNGNEGEWLTTRIKSLSGTARTLTFAPSILIPSDSAISLPKTLNQGETYITKMYNNGTSWELTSLIGGYYI